MKILLIILSLQIFPCFSKIQPVNITNGFFAAQTTNAYKVATKITYLYFVNISHISEKIERINSIVDQTVERIENDTFLLPQIMLKLRYLKEDIFETLNTLSSMTQNAPRKKRGLLNIVGTASKWLFGTLDADDEQRINEAVDHITKNQGKIADKLNEHIHIYNKFVTQYQNEINTLHETINHLENQFNNSLRHVYKSLNEINVYLFLMNNIDLAIHNLNKICKYINKLQNAIFFARINQLTEEVISINELSHLIQQTKLNPNIALFKNIQNYYRYFHISYVHTDELIVFAVHIPVHKPSIYTFYKIIPVPSNNFVLIPQHPYLGLSTTEAFTTPMKCPEIEDNLYCPHEQILEVEECVSRILRRQKPHHCQIVKANLSQNYVEEIEPGIILIIPMEAITVQTELKQIIIDNPSIYTFEKDEHQITIDGIVYSNNDQEVKEINIPAIKPIEMTDSEQIIPQYIHLRPLGKVTGMPKDHTFTLEHPVYHTTSHALLWIIAASIAITASIICIKRRCRKLEERSPSNPIEPIPSSTTENVRPSIFGS